MHRYIGLIVLAFAPVTASLMSDASAQQPEPRGKPDSSSRAPDPATEPTSAVWPAPTSSASHWP